MQYKIPIQIENEDTIVLGLSIRQLAIMMAWGWLAYSLFKTIEPNVWAQVALIFSIPIALIGIIIALVRVAEMTFLPFIFNFFRLRLNAKARQWSMGCDSYSDMEVGYLSTITQKALPSSSKSLETVLSEDTKIQENILKL